jgi:hypothetical protein
VASTAVFACDDAFHAYVIGPGLHPDTQFHVTGGTLVANAMKPVRKDHRANAFLFRSLIQYDVCIFRPRYGYRHSEHQYRDRREVQDPRTHGSISADGMLFVAAG